jgi:VWFA-related protein
MNRSALAAAVIVALAWTNGPARLFGQPQTEVDILSPDADSYVSGLASIRVAVGASPAPKQILFFVDGRQVCQLSAPPYECVWDAGAAVVTHQIRVVAEFATGNRVVRTVRTRTLDFAERVDVDIVQVTVTVSDGGGHFVKGLPRTAFRVLEDGDPQQVSHFTAEDVPLELLVAVDVSGSMATAMPSLKKAAKDFLRAVPSRDKVTLVGFNDSIFVLTRRTTDPDERVKAVDRLAPWGATALYDVILRGIDILGRQPGRHALVVFSDGEDQGSHATIRDVERRLQASDVTLYMIGQGRGVSLDALRRIMQRLAVPTGGRALFTESIDELHVAFSELLDELSNQYLLGYESTNTSRSDAFRKITVRVENQQHVRARQGYRVAAAR